MYYETRRVHQLSFNKLQQSQLEKLIVVSKLQKIIKITNFIKCRPLPDWLPVQQTATKACRVWAVSMTRKGGRVLKGYGQLGVDGTAMDYDICAQICKDHGFEVAGVEDVHQCCMLVPCSVCGR